MNWDQLLEKNPASKENPFDLLPAYKSIVAYHPGFAERKYIRLAFATRKPHPTSSHLENPANGLRRRPVRLGSNKREILRPIPRAGRDRIGFPVPQRTREDGTQDRIIHIARLLPVRYVRLSRRGRGLPENKWQTRSGQ